MRKFHLVLLIGILLSGFGCKKEVKLPDLSTENKILSFVFLDSISCSIDHDKKEISATLPEGTDISALKPKVTISDKAVLVSPDTSKTQDFTGKVVYTVRAQRGDDAKYTVTVRVHSKNPVIEPQYLCIYYGWPSSVNKSNGDVNAAINHFKNFDLIVFGDHIWEAAHGDRTKTLQIIAGLKSAKPSVKIFGYIPIGVNTVDLTEKQLKEAIDGWKAMGVYGVFGDEFGYDYGVTRSRQNLFIDYAHQQGLFVFANSWEADDAMGGTDCHLGEGDYYLLESYIAANGKSSLNGFKSRGDKAFAYKNSLKVGIASVATTAAGKTNASSNTTGLFYQSWYATAMYGFDAFQFTDYQYSSSNSTVFYFSNPVSAYGTEWKNADGVQEISPKEYTRSTNTATLHVTDSTGFLTYP